MGQPNTSFDLRKMREERRRHLNWFRIVKSVLTSSTNSASIGALVRPMTSQNSKKSKNSGVTDYMKRKFPAASSKPRGDALESTVTPEKREIPAQTSSSTPLFSRIFEMFGDHSKSPTSSQNVSDSSTKSRPEIQILTKNPVSAQNGSDLHGTSTQSRPEAQKTPVSTRKFVPQASLPTKIWKYPVSTLNRPDISRKSDKNRREGEIVQKRSAFVENPSKIPQNSATLKRAGSAAQIPAKNPVSAQNRLDLQEIPSKTPKKSVKAEKNAQNLAENLQKSVKTVPVTQISSKTTVSARNRLDLDKIPSKTPQKLVKVEKNSSDAPNSSGNPVSAQNRSDLQEIPRKSVTLEKSAQKSVEMAPEAPETPLKTISQEKNRSESHNLPEKSASTQRPTITLQESLNLSKITPESQFSTQNLAILHTIPMKISEISKSPAASTQNDTDTPRIWLQLDRTQPKAIKVEEEPTDVVEPEAAEIPLETGNLEASSVEQDAENAENPEDPGDSDPPNLDPEMEKCMDFLVEIIDNFTDPVIKTDIWKLYYSRMKPDVSEKVINNRFQSKLAPIIHRLDNYSIETRVRIMFVMGVPVEAGFLKNLRKTAVVRVDENQMITKYVACADDGGLKLEGNHSMSDKLKNRKKSMDWVKEDDSEKKEDENGDKKTKKRSSTSRRRTLSDHLEDSDKEERASRSKTKMLRKDDENEKKTNGSVDERDEDDIAFRSITERQLKVAENAENGKKASATKRRLVSSSSDESDQESRSTRSTTNKQRKIAENEKRASTPRVRIISISSDESDKEEEPSCSNTKKQAKMAGNERKTIAPARRSVGDTPIDNEKEERECRSNTKKQRKVAENEKNPSKLRRRLLEASSDKSDKDERTSCPSSKKRPKLAENEKNAASPPTRHQQNGSKDKNEKPGCSSTKKQQNVVENEKKAPTPIPKPDGQNITTSNHSGNESDGIEFVGAYGPEHGVPVSSGIPAPSVKIEPMSLTFSNDNVAYTQAEYGFVEQFENIKKKASSSSNYLPIPYPQPTGTIGLHEFFELLRHILILLEREELSELTKQIKTIIENGSDEKIPTNRINSVLDVAFYKIQRKFVVTSSSSSSLPNSTSARGFLKIFKTVLYSLESPEVYGLLEQVKEKLAELEHLDMVGANYEIDQEIGEADLKIKKNNFYRIFQLLTLRNVSKKSSLSSHNFNILYHFFFKKIQNLFSETVYFVVFPPFLILYKATECVFFAGIFSV
nr:hypothetical protein Y57A10A.a - Caenorhabditis elegans [Caenorhabditis elegans]